MRPGPAAAVAAYALAAALTWPWSPELSICCAVSAVLFCTLLDHTDK
jgi:hypothetical protein